MRMVLDRAGRKTYEVRRLLWRAYTMSECRSSFVRRNSVMELASSAQSEPVMAISDATCPEAVAIT